jgi:hypothetical protein
MYVCRDKSYSKVRQRQASRAGHQMVAMLHFGDVAQWSLTVLTSAVKILDGDPILMLRISPVFS